MKLLALTLAALAAAPQDVPAPAPQPVPVPAPAPAQDPVPVVVPVYPGGVEAPTQPTGRSSSTYRFAPRGTAVGVSGPTTPIAAPVRSLVGVRGLEDNQVSGIGIVDGLSGTGDSGNLAKQMLRNVLLAKGINIDEDDLKSQNLAVVRVEAVIPAGTKPGQHVDVTVSALSDAKSLVGGRLAMTELFDPSGQVVYATAFGSLTVGGFQAEGSAASATKNHVTVGLLSGGGKVEREIPTSIVDDHGYIHLDARPGRDEMGNLVRISEAVEHLYPGVSRVTTDGKTVKVAVPQDLPEQAWVAYLDSILGLEVMTENLARVVINERTGVIVMGGDVRLRPGAIAHGSIVVTISETEEVSQPGGFSNGETTTLDRTGLDVVEQDNPLVLVPSAVNLEEVVEVLNTLGATPRDLISILSAMSSSGMLIAEIQRL